MPPWHADPHYLPFSNDRSLTREEVKTLVHWIEAGAKRGEGSDPLAEFHKDWPEWVLGEPDLIVEIPAFDVPATGVLPYRNVSVPFALERDVWVRAIDFRPGERSVVHHIIASVGAAGGPAEGEGEGEDEDGGQAAQDAPAAQGDVARASAAERSRESAAPGAGQPGRERRRARRGRRGPGAVSLSNYVPGAIPLQMPSDAGILVTQGSAFRFQVHYTPSGKAARDATRMGLYSRKDAPRFRYRAAVMANPRLRIPAHTKAHSETASFTFRRDALVYSLHPHSHFRGRSASFVAHYPDGRRETLLNVPRYDFNWQSTYELSEPLVVPAGTRVVYTGVFDNSVQNKANPDPNRVVPWGQQTWDEMLYGVIRYRNLVEEPSPELPAGAGD
jgi:hypothetical protein